MTAQKREESVNEVGMSIQAATGERLNELGITDTADLFKVVSGFNSNTSYSGVPVYTMRGVGFQDTALASGPTVSVYLDEMPLPFSIMTQGAILDLQRVEALKGPQGTLFGQNATGGAINYIANKPTREFEAGVEVSYGRFAETEATGFLSGPISETLSYRLAARALVSDAWQRSYTADEALPPDPRWVAAGQTYRFDRERGEQKFYNARLSLLWEPNDRLRSLFTASGFVDQSDTQMPQLFGRAPLNPGNPLNPLIADYPFSPEDNRSADWGPCVNVTGGTPDRVSGLINNNNRLYDNCEEADNDNEFYALRLRVDYDLNPDMTVTSLTSWSDFERDARYESDGTIYQDYETFQEGTLEVFFQELRVAGSFGNVGSWVAGANYEYTSTFDNFVQSYGISTAVPIAVFTAIPLGPTNPVSDQTTDTYAFFGNVEYPVLDDVTMHAGIRYTNQKRDQRGCGNDGGDGTWADISAEIQTLLQILGEFPVVGGLDVGPGNCGTTGPAPTFHPVPTGFESELDEDNVSWRVGANWTVAEDQLLYANVSKGFKSGSYPTVATSASVQLEPATQEELLAYEIGAKLRLLDGTMQLNAAAFYYDYTDKQLLGAINDPVFGSLPALVNVPESHVVGGEISLEWFPLDGLRIAPSISYADSEVDGEFRNFDPFFNPITNPDSKDFSGQDFPNAPTWTGNVDTQYVWSLANGWTAFVGGNLNYQSETNGFFQDRCQEPGVSCTKTDIEGLVGNSDMVIDERAILDLRAGVEAGGWRVWAWGRNVTDEHFWNQAQHVNDALVRFTGRPRTYGVTVALRTGG